MILKRILQKTALADWWSFACHHTVLGIVEKRSGALEERSKGPPNEEAKEEPAMADQSTNSAQAAEADKGYWQANLRLIYISLAIWALVSFGFGILLRPLLSGIAVGGTDLGFWFAQQGSIYTFVILIFVYVRLMNKLDKEFDVDE